MQNRRQVVLFIKATGHMEDGIITYKPEYADNRITEIECFEIINGQPTDEHFHSFINTEGWGIQEEAKSKLGSKRLEKISSAENFSAIADGLMDFIDPEKKGFDNDTDVIVHNASYVQRLFDYAMKDVNPDWTTICAHCNFVDVLALARKLHSVPPRESSLNALCHRYRIDTSSRDCYSAKKDGELLMQLYQAINAEQKLLMNQSTLFGNKAPSNSVKESIDSRLDKVEESASLRNG